MCWEGEFVYILQQTNMICMCVCVCVCVFVNFCLYLFVLLCVVLVCRGGCVYQRVSVWDGVTLPEN